MVMHLKAYLDFNKGEHKAKSHTKYNPNGRIPTLVDETGFTLWESGVIITYLVEKDDTKHTISAASAEEKYQQLQWLFLQAAWFKLFHAEKIPSAIERYQNEILRVLGVLESELSKRSYLVGDKATVADPSFIPWNNFAFAVLLLEDTDVAAKFEQEARDNSSFSDLKLHNAKLADAALAKEAGAHSRLRSARRAK
ncbi:hypothetical protein PhCBS80983_g05586 [Powellomyces hirtus]|uniref:Glutathione transferase n=1 Tax=Powellomyces hirtus TaxID=109895 RepID=A0A507DUG0_9FUNG|nr:hypothetical protein PhCBS80983_g05586 [Powellomyces hirtus]